MLKALNQGADEMVDMSQSLAPQDDGTLRGSIKKQPGRNEIAVDVVAGGAATTVSIRDGLTADYDYALAQEFGTSKMKANPFFYPAYRALMKRIKSRVTRATSKAARDVATGG